MTPKFNLTYIIDSTAKLKKNFLGAELLNSWFYFTDRCINSESIKVAFHRLFVIDCFNCNHDWQTQHTTYVTQLTSRHRRHRFLSLQLLTALRKRIDFHFVWISTFWFCFSTFLVKLSCDNQTWAAALMVIDSAQQRVRTCCHNSNYKQCVVV